MNTAVADRDFRQRELISMLPSSPANRRANEFPAGGGPATIPGPASQRSGRVDFDTEFRAALERDGGAMIGDIHGNLDIPRFVASKMGKFREWNVKAFFVEMFESKDQALLDQFAKHGDTQPLINHLKSDGWEIMRLIHHLATGRHGFPDHTGGPIWSTEIANMCAAARANDIRIVGCDIQLGDHPDKLSERIGIRDAHWAEVYRQTMASLPEGSRGVVFGGHGHIEGVSALLGIKGFSPLNGPYEGFDYSAQYRRHTR